MITYYKVGGCVRDELLGVRSKDIDFAVEADSYEAMRDDIIAQGGRIYQERPEFLSIRARHPDFGDADYTMCRTDGFYSDARRPDVVHIGTIYDDLARRDFTVNAIAKTVDGEYIDPHGGMKDLQDMYLACVGDTQERLREDPLRLLRAMRFHLVRHFYLSEELRYALTYNYDIIESLPVERVYDEVKKCFDADTWSTLQFFHRYSWLERTIFYDMGLALSPRIKGE